MSDQIDLKSYSDDKLKKAFWYYKKEYNYAVKIGGGQDIIDRYNAIKNEMIKRGIIKVYNKENNKEKVNLDKEEKKPFVDNTVFGTVKKINDIEQFGKEIDSKVNFYTGNSKPSDNVRNGYETVLSDDELKRNRIKLIKAITAAEKAGKVDPELYKQLERLGKEIDKRHSENNSKNVTKDNEGKHNKPIRTGLQILREEYNKMPEITRKHTASERTKPFTVALTLGTAAATVLSGGMLPLVLGLSAGSALIGLGLKPFLKKVTGQDKIERQIADQFRNLNDKDFKMLTDYLTEEKIVDLKLNAVVLHALNKVNIEKTLSEKNKLQEDKNRLTEENIKLTEEFENPNTSRERKAEIEKIMQKNSKEIDSIQGYTIQKTGEKVPGKVEIAERKLKDLKRGMERQTWNYRGNVDDKGFFGRFSNIFSHRNTSTKYYLPVLNEYADAEYEMLDKKENGNDIVSSEKARKAMEDIEKDNSSRGFLGRHVGVFNSRNGVMRIMSDVMDDTFKIATTVGLATIGFAKTLSTMTNNVRINDQNI